MSIQTTKRISLGLFTITLAALVFGFMIVRAQAPTAEGNAINIAVLQRQVEEIQSSDLPAQVAALRDRMLKTENAVDNLTRKVDEATGYVKLIFAGILSLIGHRLWSILFGVKSDAESGDGIPLIGRKRR